MYLNREPLGRGNLTFSKKNRRYPAIFIYLYIFILGAALLAFWQMDRLQPLVSAALGPAPTPTPTVNYLIAQADEQYMAGEIDESLIYYEQIVEMMPEDASMWAQYSFMLTLAERYEEALAAADQSILLAPESPEGPAARSHALDWMGNYDEATISALRAIDLSPDYALAHAFLSEAYTDLGRLRQAREQAELAIELDPYEVEARRAYAYVLEYYGAYDNAIQQYLQALRLHPNRLDLWYGLARNFRGAGMFEEAVNTFLQIAIRTPEDPLPYVELGKTFFEIRDDSAAQDYLEQAVSLVCPDCPRQSYEVIRAGEFDTDKLPTRDGLYEPAWRRLGMVYLTRRNYEASIEVFEELIAWGEKYDVEISVEAYYVTATAYYYKDWCDLGVPRAVDALEIYQRNAMEDPAALNNILSIFVLCRDYAGEPYLYSGRGFENGFPVGYSEPDVIVTRPGAGTDETSEDTGDE